MENCHECQKPKCQGKNCACDVYLSSDCINNVKAVFNCSHIQTGLTLTETLEQLDAFICAEFSSITNYFTLINIGGQAEVYKGVNNLGQKELRTIATSETVNPLIIVTQNSNTIDIDPHRENLTDFINNLIPGMDNVGGGVGVYRDKISNIFHLKSLKSTNNSVVITDEEDYIDFSVTPSAGQITPQAGTNITIDNTDPLNPVISAITPTTIGSSTVEVLYDGISDPYTISTLNYQNIITVDYTITDADDQSTIFVDNGSTPVTITVPDGLKNNYTVGFVQKGTADVTFVASGTSVILSPIGLKIKGQYYAVCLEKEMSNDTFFLLGNTKI